MIFYRHGHGTYKETFKIYYTSNTQKLDPNTILRQIQYLFKGNIETIKFDIICIWLFLGNFP